LLRKPQYEEKTNGTWFNKKLPLIITNGTPPKDQQKNIFFTRKVENNTRKSQ